MRHHWEALSCLEVIKGSQIDQAGTSSGAAADTSILPPTLSRSNSVSFENITDKIGSGSGVAVVSSEISKVQSTPCKSMKAKYSVLQGISWGTLSASLQGLVH